MILRRVVVAMVALAGLGAGYQAIGSFVDSRRFPQRGRTVLGLNIDCSGSGTPAVILESGMSVPAIRWAPVQTEVAKFTRVCSYDRAGYGWSDPGPEPRTSDRIARELHALLGAAGERGPFVLVGHSFGGYNVRVFAGLYREETAGVVLVDASHGDEQQRIYDVLPPSVREREKREDQRQAWIERWRTPVLLFFGIERLRNTGDPELFYLEQQRKAREAVEAEDRVEQESWRQVLAAGDLGDMPLIVLTAGEPYEPDPVLSPAEMKRQRDVWIDELQASMARLSTRGKQIVVPGSGHMIPVEKPDAVVSAIREVWSMNFLRTSGRPDRYKQ